MPEERVHFETFDAGHGGINYRYRSRSPGLHTAWLLGLMGTRRLIAGTPAAFRRTGRLR